MMDYSFSMQCCKSSLSTVQWPCCKGCYAGTNELSKWQQSISTLHQGLLILQMNRLMNDPGAVLPLIMLWVRHLGRVLLTLITSPPYRWLQILHYWSGTTSSGSSYITVFIKRWCMETLPLMSHIDSVFHKVSIWEVSQTRVIRGLKSL